MWRRRLSDREEARVAHWMRALDALPLHAPALPDPAQLWWRAQLLRRWDARQKALVRIALSERVPVGIGLAGAALLLGWLWRQLPPASGTLVLIAGGSLIAATAAAAAALLSEE